jgi:CRISPR-associated protein Csm5
MASATLTTLSPVHIGNGQKLIRDFNFFIEGNKVGIIDLEKVVGILGKDANSISQLTNSIENKESIIQFMKGRGFTKLGAEQICSKIISLAGETNQYPSELKEQYHTALKGPCIPGSSLKGSLRTGILRYLTSETRNSEKKLIGFLKMIDLGVKPDKCFGLLEKELFGKDANSKTTRFLTVGDIQFEGIKTEVHELSYENLRNVQQNTWKYEEQKVQLVECIPSGRTAKFKLKVNLDLANKYNLNYDKLNRVGRSANITPLRDISVYGDSEVDFLKKMNECTLQVLNNDYNLLDRYEMAEEYMEKLDSLISSAEKCRDGEAVVRVGGHSGWSFMTGRWMIYQSKDVLSDVMFDDIRAKVQRTSRYKDIPLFPKTRKTNADYDLLGFVKISVLP